MLYIVVAAVQSCWCLGIMGNIEGWLVDREGFGCGACVTCEGRGHVSPPGGHFEVAYLTDVACRLQTTVRTAWHGHTDLLPFVSHMYLFSRACDKITKAQLVAKYL